MNHAPRGVLCRKRLDRVRLFGCGNEVNRENALPWASETWSRHKHHRQPTTPQEIRWFALWKRDMPHRFRHDEADASALGRKPCSRICSRFSTSNDDNLPLRSSGLHRDSIENLLVPCPEFGRMHHRALESTRILQARRQLGAIEGASANDDLVERLHRLFFCGEVFYMQIPPSLPVFSSRHRKNCRLVPHKTEINFLRWLLWPMLTIYCRGTDEQQIAPCRKKPSRREDVQTWDQPFSALRACILRHWVKLNCHDLVYPREIN